jgi:hypothetical protein
MSNPGRALRRSGERAASGRPPDKEPIMTQTTTSPTANAFLTTGPVWGIGAAAAVAGALVLFAYGAAAAGLSVALVAISLAFRSTPRTQRCPRS